MDFKEITGTLTSEQINEITFSGLAFEYYSVTMLMGSGGVLHTEDVIAVNGTLSVYGFGDILMAAIDTPAESVTFKINRYGSNEEVYFTQAFIVPSNIKLPPGWFDRHFLNTASVGVMPVGAAFSLTLMKEEVSTNPENMTTDWGAEFEPHRLGAALVYDIVAPDQPGFYKLWVGDTTWSMFVFELGTPHRIEFRNVFNAPQTLYINASITPVYRREASEASVDKSSVEYDIRKTSKFEFSLKNISANVAHNLRSLLYANDISIDGHKVTVSEIEFKFPQETHSLYELTFTATLSSPLIYVDDPQRIFQSPFTAQFS